MYEWENKLSKDKIEIQKHELKKEIKRICEVTLRGQFSNQEDRNYWVKRLGQLNSRLLGLESM